MDAENNKKLGNLKEGIKDSQGKKKSLFLSLDKVEEWEKSFYFIPREVKDLTLKRNEFRLQRLFKDADKLKEQIWNLGYGLRDSEAWVYLYKRRYFVSPEIDTSPSIIPSN